MGLLYLVGTTGLHQLATSSDRLHMQRGVSNTSDAQQHKQQCLVLQLPANSIIAI